MSKTDNIRKFNNYNPIAIKKSSNSIGFVSDPISVELSDKISLKQGKVGIPAISSFGRDFGEFTIKWDDPEKHRYHWFLLQRDIERRQYRAWRRRVNVVKNVDVIHYLYVFVGETKFSIPEKFEELAKEIERSRYILTLPDNWDDEGSKPYKQETLICAIHFLLDYFYLLDKIYAHSIKVPQIGHGVNGGIDILWKSKDYRLLINIHEAPSNIASFYGDDYKDNKIKGTFNPTVKNYGLISSLLSYK